MPDTVMTTESSGLHFRNRSNETAKLAGALAAAQKNFAPIPKDREVTVTTLQGGTYKFKYATLDAIMSATMPALAEQGLAISQALTDWGNNYAVETTLYHSSGEWISNVTPMFLSGRRTKDGRELPPGNQELGSAQSYARRYGVTALLCITADEDDDGNHADGNHSEGERIPFKPRGSGSAGAGTQFRPERRQMVPKNFVEAARQDGTLDETRKKGELPAKGNANGPQAQNAIKRVEWVKKAIEGFAQAQTKDELQQWWKAEAERLSVIESAMPNEYERLLAAYDAAIERTAVRAA